jgi:hypothetical protein
VPAAVTALVLLAICALVTTALVQRLLGERPVVSYETVATRVHATAWNQLPVLVGGGAAVLAGGALLFAAVLRGRPVVLALTSEEGIDAGTPRRGLKRSLQAAAASVDGVAGAALRLGRRRVRVKVRTNRTNREGLADAVRAAVEGRVERVGLVEVPEVRVRVRGGRR